MDNALLPYGLQSQETIKSRLRSLLSWLDITNKSVDVIVIACNTASTYALETARQYTATPIVGVVPAIKPAANSSKRKHIGLLATPATSKNTYTANLISNFASDCQVDIYHTTELVAIAEHFHWHKSLKQDQLKTELDRLNINTGIDKLVLGCTHFPIIKNALRAQLHTEVDLIDSGYAIAKRVEYLLTQQECTHGGENINGVKEKLLASNPNDLTHWYATCTAAIKHCINIELIKL